MKIKVNEATGPVLDWMVAKCEGFKKIYAAPTWTNKHGACGDPQVMVSNKKDSSYDYLPSRSWSQGGPIIERQGINVCIQNDEPGYKISPARRWYAQVDTRSHTAYGPTPLIAAMRCFVASKLGDGVDVPEETL